MKYLHYIPLVALMFSACTHTGKVVLDSSPNRPSWVDKNRVTWQDGDKILFRASHTVRGDERLNGCYDLAEFDVKEKLLSEISNDVRGSLENAQESISESAETLLTKVRSGQYSGSLTGLRFTEQYFERYVVHGEGGDIERVDCQTIGEMTIADFNRTKQAVLNKVVAIDPRLKETVRQKNINFFKDQSRDTASVQTTDQNQPK